MIIVGDLEADGLIEIVTKIHCLCIYDVNTNISESITDYSRMREVMTSKNLTFICHNCVRYDIPVLEKILGIDLSAVKQIDTLGLSWYLYPSRLIHGLESWGRDIGIQKPLIETWIDTGDPDFINKMVHRCTEDVKINAQVWKYEFESLTKIYSDRGDINRILGYITFKLQCAREQEEEKFKVDIEKAKINLAILQKEADKKREMLKSIMPNVNLYKTKSKPKVMYKKDGELSELGRKWLEFLKGQNLPEYHNGAVKYIYGTEKGNPNSQTQLKEWLFSLGWKPITFKYVREKLNGVTDYTAPAKKIPQISSDDDTGLCVSVKELFVIEPRLEELESFFIINNRISYLNGTKGNSFLEKVDENKYIKAEINGLTNTLRFQHKKPIVNLPQIPKLYWKEVRECLIASDDEHILCGSDMSQLEDQTKRHYMFYYDPEYVKEMMKPGFDAHLYIAIKSGLLTEDEVEWYKKVDKTDNLTPEEILKYARIKGIRLKAKKTNFAAIYGAGAPKIAVTANIPVREAKVFYDAYWVVNWSVKKIVENTMWKTIGQQKWLWNPVAQLWYSLKTEKDIFSTLNQGTGSYCFDTWVKNCRQQGYKICMQYHDEHVGNILKGSEEKVRAILLKAIEQTNQELKLNVTLGISIDIGRSYADIH